MLHLNDHLYTKLMCLFVGSKFLVSHCRLCTPRYFYGLSLLEICLTTLMDLSLEGVSIPTCYYPTQVFFTTLFNRVTLLDFVHLIEPTQSNTKRNVDSSTMHSHPFNEMSPCICNAMRHCMLYYATCIMNVTWTTQSTTLITCI